MVQVRLEVPGRPLSLWAFMATRAARRWSVVVVFVLEMDPPNRKFATLRFRDDLSRSGSRCVPSSSRKLRSGSPTSGSRLNSRTYVLLNSFQFLLSPEAAVPDSFDLVSLLGSFRLEFKVVGFPEDLYAIVFLLSIGGAGKVEVIVVDVGVDVVVSDVVAVVGPFH